MTLSEQIASLETQAGELTKLLCHAWQQEVQTTRVMSDEGRAALLERLADGMEPGKRSEVVEEHIMSSTNWSRGYNDWTDESLLREWFEIVCGNYDDAEDVTGSPLWVAHLADNLGVIGVLGKWLNERKKF